MPKRKDHDEYLENGSSRGRQKYLEQLEEEENRKWGRSPGWRGDREREKKRAILKQFEIGEVKWYVKMAAQCLINCDR